MTAPPKGFEGNFNSGLGFSPPPTTSTSTTTELADGKGGGEGGWRTGVCGGVDRGESVPAVLLLYANPATCLPGLLMIHHQHHQI